MDKKNKNNIAKILLAFGVLASPMMLANQVSADNSIANTTNANNIETKTESDSVTTENVINENKEEKEQPKEVTAVAEDAEEDTTEANSQTEEKSVENTELVENKEEVDFKLDASQRHELKEVGYTDEQIQEIENSIKKSLAENPGFNVYEFVTSKVNEKKSVNEENKLEFSDEAKPEAVAAEATAEDAITNVEITIGGAKNGEKTEIVNPTALPERINGSNTDINLEARVDFDIPQGTKAGKTFDFEVSKNVNLHGILVDEDKAVPVVYDGVEIASGTKLTDGRRGYRYTFNKNVDGLEDIRVRILYPLWIDPDKVPLNSEKETVTVKVAGEQASKDYKIEYENVVSEDKLGSTTLSGIANIEEVTSTSYEHIIYVNPRGDQGLINSNVTIENDVDHDSATFDEDVKNSVKIYKVKDSDKLPLSFGNNFDDGNYEDVTNKAEVKLVRDGNKNKLVVNVNQGDAKNYYKDDAYDKSAYIIKYKGKRTPEKETKTKITYKADRRLLNGNKESLVTDGRFAWTWTNEIVFDDADAIALANKTYNLGDKVWIDADEDGSQGDTEKGLEGVEVILKGINMSDKVTTTDANGNYKFEGLKNGEYTVEFKIPTGYAPTTAKAKDVTDENNSDASKDATNNKKAIATGVINGRDNMNVDFGVVKSNEGSFTEHHVYEVYKDGKLQDTSKIDIEKTTGKEKETFKTSAKPNGTEKDPKEGFTLVKDKITKSPEITEDVTGAEVTPNYINEKDLEVTYVYRKDITTAGSFTEHHIYEVYKDGKLQDTSKIDIDKTTGTEEETFTTYAKSNGTEKDPKEGFTFVPERTEKSLDIEEKLNGKEVTINYINEKDLEVTYVYRKDVKSWTPLEKTGKFQEHHIYITKDKDGKEIKREIVDGDVTGGTKDMTYETGKKEKDGFKFVRTENPVEEPKFNGKGETTKGNYKPGVKQEITYVYEKTQIDWTPLTPAEENGSFQEHHVYEVYKDGKLIESSEITLEETTGTEEEYFTTSAKPNGTKDQPKEGFKLVKELIAKSIDVESHLTGEEIKEHYKNNEKLEVRYVYRKDITTTPEIPWTPLEPSEPVTPVEPEEPTTPVVPDQPEEPATPVEPETPGEDPKETPWTPLTPAEEVTPQNPDDNETPKEDPKETPKEDSKETPKEDSKETSEKQSKKLPKAGADYELLKLAAGALSIVSGLGLSLGRKKED